MANFNENYNINTKNMSNILFRADSSSKIGLGHVMRDLVLAKQFPHAKITFATQDLKGNINHTILQVGYKVKILQSNSKKELVKLINKLHIDMLIIDHYKISYKKEKYIKKKTGVKFFILDDTYEKHHCDILLNHNIGASKKRYKNLVPSTCKVKCGSKYTLLRDEFYQEKKKNYKPNKRKTFFVAMGGADTAELNIKILKVLESFKNIKVNIVTTTTNKNLEKLKIFSENKQWIKLHINSNNIAKLMKKSDFAIITPSVIVNEVYFMRIPFVVIKTASNQNEIYEFLKKNAFLTLKKFNPKKFNIILHKTI